MRITRTVLLVPVLCLLLAASLFAEEDRDRRLVSAYQTLARQQSNSLDAADRLAALLASVDPDLRDRWNDIFQALAVFHQGKYAESAAMFERILAPDREESPSGVARAFAMRLRGLALSKMGDDEAALIAYDRMLERFGKAEDSAIAEQAGQTLLHRAAAVAEMESGGIAQALEAYDAIAARFHTGESEELRRLAAVAMLTKGMLLMESGRDDESEQAMDTLLATFPQYASRAAMSGLLRDAVYFSPVEPDDSPAESAQDQPGDAAGDASVRSEALRDLMSMYFQARTLEGNADDEGAAASFSAIIDRYRNDADDPAFAHTILLSMLGRAGALERLGDVKAALKTYAEIIAVFRDNPDGEIQRYVALAMMTKSAIHGRMGDEDAALAGFADLTDSFRDSADTTVREQCAQALLVLAKAQEKRGETEKADHTAARLEQEYDPRSSPIIEQCLREAELLRAGLEKREKTASPEKKAQ